MDPVDPRESPILHPTFHMVCVYIVLCDDMQCYALLCYALLCDAKLWFSLLCHTIHLMNDKNFDLITMQLNFLKWYHNFSVTAIIPILWGQVKCTLTVSKPVGMFMYLYCIVSQIPHRNWLKNRNHSQTTIVGNIPVGQQWGLFEKSRKARELIRTEWKTQWVIHIVSWNGCSLLF